MIKQMIGAARLSTPEPDELEQRKPEAAAKNLDQDQGMVPQRAQTIEMLEVTKVGAAGICRRAAMPVNTPTSHIGFRCVVRQPAASEAGR